MIKNKKGQISLWEIVLFLAVIGAGAYFCYTQFNKKSEINNFKGHSQQVVHEKTIVVKRYQLIELAFSPFSWSGCGLPVKKDPDETVAEVETQDPDVQNIKDSVNAIVTTNKE